MPNWRSDFGGCSKKAFWTKDTNWILFGPALKCISSPKKPRGKGLQRRGQRRRVFQRSCLKDRCPNAGVILDFFCKKKVPNWRSDFGGCSKKAFWTKVFNRILFGPALKCISSPKNREGKACEGVVKGAEFSKGAASKIDAQTQAWC